MITISTNKQFSAEKNYIIDVFFGDLLGLEYRLQLDAGTKNYEISLENGNKAIIEDHFFGAVQNSYLIPQNIPDKVSFAYSEYFPENDLPVIYGSDKVYTEQNEDKKTITSGIDVFASAFFMLSRWEEYVQNTLDEQERFMGKDSLAYRNGFLQRPVVNEYSEFLWNILTTLGIDQQRKKCKDELIPTHDVDYLSFPRFLFSDAKHIFKGKQIKERLVKLKYSILKDPYDTFDYLMKLSESINAKARFYFLDGKSNYDAQNYLMSPKFAKLIEKIQARGHIIGFHPGYYAFNDAGKMKEEKNSIENKIHDTLEEGRQHFLRFKIPHTWKILEDSGMKIDSTLGYPDHTGFRCGICHEFPVFDIVGRKKLELKERPLIAMDTTLVRYNKFTPEQAEEKLSHLSEQVKKYNGQFVLLWHNTAVSTGIWKKYRKVFENIYARFQNPN